MISVGGRFGYEDDGQTPNTHVIYYDYEPAPVIFELRGLPKSQVQRKATWRASDMDEYHGMQIATIVRCENGYVANRSSGGTAAYDNNDKLIARADHSGPSANFLDAVRSRRAEDLVCPVLQGHYSASLCPHGQHLIPLGPKDVSRGDPGDRQRRKDCRRGVRPLPHPSRRQRDRPEKDADPHGPDAHDGPADRCFTGPFSDTANMVVSRNYREPYVVPEKV